MQFLKAFTNYSILCFVFISYLITTNASAQHYKPLKTTTWSDYVGTASINCIKAVDGEDEIGVFVRDNNGNEMLVGASVIGSIIKEYFYVTVYGDDITTANIIDGAVEGQELIFKIWDKSQNKEYLINNNQIQVQYNPDVSSLTLPVVWKSSGTYGLLILNTKIIGDLNNNLKLDMTDVIGLFNIISDN